MSLTSRDRRYERYVRPVDPVVRRTTESRRWGGWDLHLEHVGDPDARVRMLLVHGAGGSAAAMWPFAAHLSQLGAVVTTVDLPGYGRTASRGRAPVSYGDWQRVLADLVTTLDDGRPLILAGASMGGMLALDAATLSGRGDLVVATCLLDGSDADVRAVIVRAPWMARVAPLLLRLTAGPLAALRLPMRCIAPMARISNSPGLVGEVLRDPRGGGGSMPLRWFRSFLEGGPAVPPEEYDGPPVLLVHPDADRWTPARLSADYLNRVAGETRLVMLEGCGHFPVEEPGFGQLLDVVRAEIERLTLAAAG